MFLPFVEKVEGEVVHCPDGAQYVIPEGPHAGRSLRCENFDAYYAHMLHAREYAAAKLLEEEL